jgi:hypothetical protein
MQNERDLQARLEGALAEGQRLREEVRRLKAILAQHSIPLDESLAPKASSERCLPAQSDVAKVGTLSNNQAKLTLFRSLFRGREDVYAERWRTKEGTWAYRPSGKKDWQAILASRPEEHKKVDRQTRTLYAITDEVVRQHLTGKKTIGVYPLLPDETCWFLAGDFDKKTWEEDALAFVATCQRAGVPAYLERSRSGNGGHVWIFFDRPLPAVLARKMGCALLTQTMERRHHLGLDSYDRFFPNQDTMPKGIDPRAIFCGAPSSASVRLRKRAAALRAALLKLSRESAMTSLPLVVTIWIWPSFLQKRNGRGVSGTLTVASPLFGILSCVPLRSASSQLSRYTDLSETERRPSDSTISPRSELAVTSSDSSKTQSMLNVMVYCTWKTDRIALFEFKTAHLPPATPKRYPLEDQRRSANPGIDVGGPLTFDKSVDVAVAEVYSVARVLLKLTEILIGYVEALPALRTYAVGLTVWIRVL